jgi:hypothetical protein
LTKSPLLKKTSKFGKKNHQAKKRKIPRARVDEICTDTEKKVMKKKIIKQKKGKYHEQG